MKRILVVLLLITTLACGSYAMGFAIGAKAGIGMSQFTMPDTLEDASGVTNKEKKIGFAWQFAAEAKLSFLPLFGLRIELGLSGYSGKFTFDAPASNTMKLKHTMFNVFVGPQLNLSSFFVYAGIEAGFKLKSTYEHDNGTTVTEGDIEAKTILWSFVAGLGYEMGLAGPIKMPISIVFKHGISSLGKDIAASVGNMKGGTAWALYFNIGILFSI